MEGIIEKWLDAKNFGFINIGEEKSLFFHRNELAEGYEPKEGDKVEFEKSQSEKGPMAVKVRKVEETAAAPAEEPAAEEPAAEEPAAEEPAAEPTEETTEEVKEE